MVLAAAATAEVALDLGRGTSVGGTAGLVLANLAEPLVGATLLLWLVGRVDLRRKRHLSAFLGAAVVAAPIVGAAIAATTFVYVIGGSGWLRFASEWWAGDGLAVLVVGGAVLSLRFGLRLPLRRAAEGAGLAAVAVVCTYVLFDQGWFAFVYVPVVVLVVLAFRVGTAGVAVTSALVSFVAAGITAEADAFWASVDVSPADRVLYLQLALAVIVATVLTLAAEISERERIVARLARSEAERSTAVERSELAGRVELASLQASSLRESAEQLSRSASVDDVAEVAVASVRKWGGDHSAFFALEDDRLQLRAILGVEGPSGPLHGETPLSLETPVTEAVKLGRAVVPGRCRARGAIPFLRAGPAGPRLADVRRISGRSRRCRLRRPDGGGHAGGLADARSPGPARTALRADRRRARPGTALRGDPGGATPGAGARAARGDARPRDGIP